MTNASPPSSRAASAAPATSELTFLSRLTDACLQGAERLCARFKSASGDPAASRMEPCYWRLHALAMRLIVLQQLIFTGRLDQLIAGWKARLAAATTRAAPERGEAERPQGERPAARGGAAGPGGAISDQMMDRAMSAVLRSLRRNLAPEALSPDGIVGRLGRQFTRILPAASRLIGADWAGDALEAINERDRLAPSPAGAGRALMPADPAPSRRARYLASASGPVVLPRLRFASG